MNAPVVHLETRVERAWREYVEAQEKAQRTLSLEDGMAAGRAWYRFILEFSKPE